MRNYRLARQADRDLIEIYGYGFEHFGELQADKYQRKLEDCFRLLTDQPNLGRRHNVSGQHVRVFFHENHVVVYQVAESYVLIARVLSMRRNWQRVLRSL